MGTPLALSFVHTREDPGTIFSPGQKKTVTIEEIYKNIARFLCPADKRDRQSRREQRLAHIMNTDWAQKNPADMHWLILTSTLSVIYAMPPDPDQQTIGLAHNGPAFWAVRDAVTKNNTYLSHPTTDHKKILTEICNLAKINLEKLGEFDPFHKLPEPGDLYTLRTEQEKWITISIVQYHGNKCRVQIAPEIKWPGINNLLRLNNKMDSEGYVHLKQLRPPNCYLERKVDKLDT